MSKTKIGDQLMFLPEDTPIDLVVSPETKKLTEIERSYLAGFFDGDGSLSITSQKIKKTGYIQDSFIIVFAQSDYGILKHWRDKTDLGKIYRSSTNESIKSTRDCYNWRITDRMALELLRLIYDYLIIKRDQALICIEFMATKGSPGKIVSDEVRKKRESLRLQLKECKLRPVFIGGLKAGDI